MYPDIGTRWELFVDDLLVDSLRGVRLAPWRGRPVRLRFALKDADLLAFRIVPAGHAG